MEENKQPSIFQLKRQYKRLFLIKIKDYDIVFRLLTWGDMKIIRSFLFHSIELQNSVLEDIFAECVIEHNIPDLDNANAGILPTISNLIINLSSYKTPEDFINQMSNARDKSSTFEGQIESVLSKAFIYNVRELDSMLVSEVLTELGKAERVLTGEGLPDLPIRLESEVPAAKKNTITKPPPGVIPPRNMPVQRDTKVPPEDKKPFIVNVEEENRILEQMMNEDD